MIDDRTDGSTFGEGDEVVLDRGTYQDTMGVFVRHRIQWHGLPTPRLS
jgi:hypothetical protein